MLREANLRILPSSSMDRGFSRGGRAASTRDSKGSCVGLKIEWQCTEMICGYHRLIARNRKLEGVEREGRACDLFVARAAL